MNKSTITSSLIIAAIAYFGTQKDGLSLSEIIFLLMVCITAHIQEYFGRHLAADKDRQSFNQGELIIFRLIHALGYFFIPALYITLPWFDFANYKELSVFPVIGTILARAGILGLFKSHFDLEKQWSPIVELQGNHELITKGVYRFARHPMYLSIFTLGFAQAFLLNNWIAGLGGILGFYILYLSRINKEEKMLREKFGKSYEDYCRHVGRLMPKMLSSWS
tara:strand:+ start:215 stop:877 length:663 start_codon:yes stop_codon:yes gene_type:complete